jgi:hypothetical protein
LRAHTINASANAQSSTCRINLSLILFERIGKLAFSDAP